MSEMPKGCKATGGFSWDSRLSGTVGVWRGSGLKGWVHKGALSTRFNMNTTSTHVTNARAHKLTLGVEPLLIFHQGILL